jgi:molybdopterin synthase sulfur carrier subunit
MIAVLFFGRMADLAGQRRMELPASPDGDSLFSLRDRLLATAMAGAQVEIAAVRMSLNGLVCQGDHAVADGDEVAFFSVFSGG